MSQHGDAAYEAFFQGYNCSQCIALAFAQEMGLTREQALKISSGFGGGVGRMREVCGAFSGMVLVLGAIYGNTDPAGKSALYAEVQALAEQYRSRNGGGSIVCRELLGLKQAEGSPVAIPRTGDYYRKRPCPQLIRLAGDLMEEYINAHPIPAPPEPQEQSR